MGMMKAYFKYSGDEICGIPSITILGEREDWERLYAKVDRLQEFGDEPDQYANRLRPLLSRITSTFDSPTSASTREFWDQIVHAKVLHSTTCGVPPTQYELSGWILGFFFWDNTGKAERKLSNGTSKIGIPGRLVLDGITYGSAYLEDLPTGYAKAEFLMLTGPVRKGWVLAGSIGKLIIKEAPSGYNQALEAQTSSKEMKATESRQKRQKVAKVHPDNPQQIQKCPETGCLSDLFRKLNCFTHRQDDQEPTQAQAPAEFSEKSDSEGDREVEHSTIQPLSAWFLIGPRQDLGPFIGEEEVDGPTVDAIESCDGVEPRQGWY